MCDVGMFRRDHNPMSVSTWTLRVVEQKKNKIKNKKSDSTLTYRIAQWYALAAIGRKTSTLYGQGK